MGLLDSLANLFSTKDNVTQGDILDDFRGRYPQYGNTSDADLAGQIAKTYPKYYGYLKEFDSESPVPHKAVRDTALSEVSDFQAKYPKYKADDPVKLAARMEQVYPDQYPGLAKRVSLTDSPQKPAKATETGVEGAIPSEATPLSNSMVDAAARILRPTNPILGMMLEIPGIKESMAKRVGSFGAANVKMVADTVATIPAASEYLFGKQNEASKVADKTVKYLNGIAKDWQPTNPSFADKFVSGAASLSAAAAMWAVPGSVVGRIPAMGVMGTKIAASLGVNLPVVFESATEAGGKWQEARAAGGSDATAAEAAAKTFFTNLALIKATNIFGGKAAPASVKNFIANGSKEFIQEFGQSLIQEAADSPYIRWPKVMWNALKDPKKRQEAIESGIIGFALGGPVGTLAEHVEHSQLTEENIPPDIKQKLALTPALAEAALGKDYPVSHLRLVDALDVAVKEADQEKRAGVSPEVVAGNTIEIFVSEVEAAGEIADIEAKQTIAEKAQGVPEAEQQLANIDAAMAELDAQAEVASEPAVRKVPRKYHHEVRKIASQIRAGEVETIRAGKDPIWAEAQAIGLIPNEDTKEEFKGLDMSFKMGKKGVTKMRLDEFAASMVDQGVMQQGEGSNEALARLMKFKDRQRTPQIDDVWDGAVDIWLARRQKQKSIKSKVTQVLAANQLEDKVGIEFVNEIIVDPQAYEEGYHEEYQAGKKEIKGSTLTNRTNGIIKLATGATDFTGYHEAWHAISNLVATETEKEVIARRYAPEAKRLNKNVREVSADAFAGFMKGQSSGSRLIDRVFKRIAQFLEKLGNWVRTNGFTSAEDIFNKYGQKAGTQYSAEDTLFPDKQPTLEERLQYRVKEAKKSGLNDQQALKYAKDKLAAEEKTRPAAKAEQAPSGPPAQKEFGAEGVQGFGQGRQGESELELQYSAEPRERAPMFFSQLEQTIQAKMPNKAGPADVMGIIRNAGTKQEEIQWSGIQEWLADKKTVTKQEVIDFVRQNQVQIKEVTLERSETKFSAYQLPGGENYRELLLTLPLREVEKETNFGNKYKATEVDFRSSHFDEPNILAHVRFNDRIDANGKHVLFLEEIQSDWHAAARKLREDEIKRLMQTKGMSEEEASAVVPADFGYKTGEAINFSDFMKSKGITDDARIKKEWNDHGDSELYREWDKENKRNSLGVPDAPFKKYHEIALKRMLRYAAENGYESIAWTTGEQQVDRYESMLRQRADKILWIKTPKGVQITAFKGGEKLRVPSTPYADNELTNAIGKAMGDQIRNDPNQSGVFEGESIRISDTGMAGFYDQMIPSFLNKYAKKWGGRVGTTTFSEVGDLSPEAQRIAPKNLDKAVAVHSLDITPSMRDSVIYVGQPMYSAEDKKTLTLPAKYSLVGKKPLSQHFNEWREERQEKISTFKEYTAGPTSRLRDIHPSLAQKLREFEFKSREAIAKDMAAAQAFLTGWQKVKKVNPTHLLNLDLALKNGDTASAELIANHYGFKLDKLWPMLNAIHSRAKSVGFEFGYLPGYFPRVGKNYSGFMRFMMKQGEISGEIERAIAEKQDDLGRYLTEAEKFHLINSFIRGYVRSPITLAKTGNMRTREIAEVTPALNEFYYGSADALLRYITEVNEVIEARKWFGKSEVKPDGKDTSMLPMSDVEKRESALSFNNLDDSIGAYVGRLLENKLITPNQQSELVRVLRARFGYVATRGSLGLYKNVTYLDTIANPISAITNLEDLGLAAYRSVWHMPGSFIRALANKSKISLDDIHLERLNEEVRDMTTSSAVLRFFMRNVGFAKLDQVGKETYLNTVIDKYRSALKKGDSDLENRIVEYFGAESDQVIEDLESGKTTERVLLLAFNEVLESQPAALSEMPLPYLENPAGRLFYTLKTFMAKRLDFIRNEIKRQPTTPDKLMTLIKLWAILAVFGAGRDELIDFLLNRKTKLSDRVVDNLLKPFGLNKYLLYQIRDRGPIEAIGMWLLPPSGLAQAVIRDLRYGNELVKVGNHKEPRKLELPGHIPAGGKAYDWWFGRAAQRHRAKNLRESNPKYILNKKRKEFKAAHARK